MSSQPPPPPIPEPIAPPVVLCYEDSGGNVSPHFRTTWCGEVVPSYQATIIRRAVRCPACRAAMGLPGAGDPPVSAPPPERRTAAFRRKTIALARTMARLFPEENPLAHRFACELVERHADDAARADRVIELVDAALEIRRAAALLERAPWWAWRRRRRLVARIASVAAEQMGEGVLGPLRLVARLEPVA